MEARQHRLDLACRIAGVLVETASAATMALFEELDVPISVVTAGRQASVLTNAAWRALFGSRDLIDAIPVGSAKPGTTLYVDELEVDVGGPPCYVAVMLRVGDAEMRQVFVACIDITDDVLARKLAVDAGVLVWSGRGVGTFDYCNRAWLAYGASNSDWTHPIEAEDRAKCIDGLAWAIREHGSIDIEARIRRSDGMYRWHQIRFAVASPGARWFGTAVDIHDARAARGERNELATRLVAAKSEAETASRLKDQFLAAVSHELRAPLTTIVLWEGVLRDEADPVLRAKALDVIRQSALGQSRVVADLLDVSRGIAGKLHVDLRPIDLGELVREAIEAMAPVAAARGITFEHRDTVVPSEVKGDPARLRQVLDNLLSNAIKFSDARGTIAVTVGRRGRSIVVEIRDHGCGISADLLPHVFEPFSQSRDTVASGPVGLGLGLTIAKQLVDLHGGTLTAANNVEGGGARLTMTIPSTSARRKSTPPAGVPRRPSLEQTRVLVVDDDRRVLDALAVLLDRAGAIVDTAESAAVARERISDRPPDVVVCDIAMPGEDGYKFMRALRAGSSKIGAIALTAYASEHDVESALAAGFDRHLAKPVDFDRLVASIDELAVARRGAFGSPGQ
jgi:signal transduction histidine kinase/CheY-like chemotaxis protein